jgi:ribonuclease III
MPSNLEQLQSRVGYKFRDINLLSLALTHPSYEVRLIASNRRLELVGDKVMNLIITEALYEKYPQFDEGKITQILARIIGNISVAAHTKAIGLGEHLIINPSFANERLHTRDSILADAFEALVGAIQRDGGFEAARDFVLREFEADLNDTSTNNPKGDLQELLQGRSQPTATYRDISSSGPVHDPTFVSAAMCGDVEIGRGNGRTKKEAEHNAAKKALEKLRATSDASNLAGSSPRSLNSPDSL